MGGKLGLTVAQRLEQYIFYSPDGCWYWTGAYFCSDKRGRLQVDGKSRIAYRLTYALMFGPIPEGKFLCHTCDNPKCVNPHHLFVGTAMDNSQDMKRKGRTRNMPKGVKHPGAKLNDEKVLEIRSLKGLTHGEIAEMYSVSGSLISMIRNRNIWKHI